MPSMRPHPPRLGCQRSRVESPRRGQRGFGVVTAILLLVVVLALVVVTVKVASTYTEYSSIQRVLKSIAASSASTPNEVRSAFESQRQAEGITSLATPDLEVSRDGDGMVIAFAYAREVPLVGPLSLLVRYDGKVRKPSRPPS